MSSRARSRWPRLAAARCWNRRRCRRRPRRRFLRGAGIPKIDDDDEDDDEHEKRHRQFPITGVQTRIRKNGRNGRNGLDGHRIP